MYTGEIFTSLVPLLTLPMAIKDFPILQLLYQINGFNE